MKITFLLPGFHSTGGPYTIYKYCELMTELGHDVNLCLPYMSIKWAIGDYEKLHNWLYGNMDTNS